MARSNRPRGWPETPEAVGVDLIDNHAHLDHVDRVEGTGETWDATGAGDSWAAGTEPTTAQHLARARAAGVTAVVQIGCDLPAAQQTVELVDAHPELLGGIAIHPNEAPLHAGVREVAPDGLEPDPREHHATSLDDAIAQIAELAQHPRIRCIGETGLDYFRGGERAREVQRASFRAHVALAKELGLALQIHDRDAHRDVIDLLDADGAPERTVFHCFSGDAEMARLCADRGWYLSFAGPVSFKANDELRAALRAVPLSQVMVETDAPFLTPVPHRGRPNAPYLLPLTVRSMADTLGLDPADVGRATAQTARQVYGPW